MNGWDAPGFDDSSWKPATLFAAPPVNVEIQGYVGSPIQNNVTLTAQSMVEPIPGVYVYDMGQNMVGVPRLTFKGKAGQEITIRFAGDLAQLVRLLNPYIDKENNRRGARLVSGGVY